MNLSVYFFLFRDIDLCGHTSIYIYFELYLYSYIRKKEGKKERKQKTKSCSHTILN